jgi:serine/threonine protein kinase
VQIGAARIYIRLKESARRQFTAALWDADLGLGAVRKMIDGVKYKVITTIGRGGMGVVMQARDLRIRRTVAMKVIKTEHQFSRENVLRFVDEAQLTGQLEHPNIIPVYELGTDEQGEIFYTMKYVKGITLDNVLRGLQNGRQQMIEKYSLGTLLTIFQKICDGVAFAHSKGVVHRDLKPENVMIGSYGEVLVMDWGLAKNMTGASRPANHVETARDAAAAGDLRGFETMHGLIVGTPPYLSPEQARGELDKIDERSDVFVLGAILYAILTLRPPVEGSTVGEMIDNIVGSRITPPLDYNQPVKSAARDNDAVDEPIVLHHCPGQRVPDGLSAVVMKAMQAEPEKRYQTVEEMQAEITAWQGGFAPKAERASLGKQVWLWALRHRTGVTVFAVGFLLFNIMMLAFIYQLTVEKNRALSSEQRAMEGERLAAERLAELRGTAPTFYSDAASLLKNQDFEGALARIDYALEQVPNEAGYHALRGNVLQSLLRWEEAVAAYRRALDRNPRVQRAQENYDLTSRLLSKVERKGRLTAEILRELHAALLKQNRGGEAQGVAKLLRSGTRFSAKLIPAPVIPPPVPSAADEPKLLPSPAAD